MEPGAAEEEEGEAGDEAGGAAKAAPQGRGLFGRRPSFDRIRPGKDKGKDMDKDKAKDKDKDTESDTDKERRPGRGRRP